MTNESYIKDNEYPYYEKPRGYSGYGLPRPYVRRYIL